MSIHHENSHETSHAKGRSPLLSIVLLIVGFGAAYLATSLLF